MRTINDLTPTELDKEIIDYSYQTSLTVKLDNINSDFTQEIINEIVLWKVNRYSFLDNKALNLLNQIKKTDLEINTELTKEILLQLLDKQQKGIRLAMASTILRFKNPVIYQIIDQRVFRFIYGFELKYSETDINRQVSLYLDYLIMLRQICLDKNISFENADRVLYSLDKMHNADSKLNGY